MYNIFEIMNLLDWNNSRDIQQKGIELAKEVKCINVFLQPLNSLHNKNVWDNCAKILCKKSDDELKPYLIPLLEWLQDLNWPGALIIYERLKAYNDIDAFIFAKDECIKRAVAMNDQVWIDNISKLLDD